MEEILTNQLEAVTVDQPELQIYNVFWITGAVLVPSKPSAAFEELAFTRVPDNPASYNLDLTYLFLLGPPVPHFHSSHHLSPPS